MAHKLTAKQELFVQEYLVDLNATQAAIRAGYSEKTADVQGPRLLGNVRVKERLDAAVAERTERVQITQDEVLTGMRTEAKFYGEGSSHGARVSAWAHLGKHTGTFKEEERRGGETVVNVQILQFGSGS